MKAVCWNGINNVGVEDVPDPKLINPRDAVIQVSSTAICGSDLHLYDGYIPFMKPGDILGHEFMGEVVEVGSGVKNLSMGDRVVVPFPIACGNCYFCQNGMWSFCDNSNPKAALAEGMFGHAPAGIFGYSHLMGGYAGGQAEYVRVPYADVGPFKMGQTHVHRYLQPLFEMIESGQIDPSFIVTHIFPLEDAPDAYEIFKHKVDGCIKVVMKPS